MANLFYYIRYICIDLGIAVIYVMDGGNFEFRITTFVCVCDQCTCFDYRYFSFREKMQSVI